MLCKCWGGIRKEDEKKGRGLARRRRKKNGVNRGPISWKFFIACVLETISWLRAPLSQVGARHRGEWEPTRRLRHFKKLWISPVTEPESVNRPSVLNTVSDASPPSRLSGNLERRSSHWKYRCESCSFASPFFRFLTRFFVFRFFPSWRDKQRSPLIL